jgi:membrane-bound lytic murein transglycosylase A
MIPRGISISRTTALRSLAVALCAVALAASPAAAAVAKSAAKKQSQPKKTTQPSPLKIPNSQFEPLAWHQIDGWMKDHHAEAFATFLASCKPILRSTPKIRATRPAAYNALHEVCGRAVEQVPVDDAGARAFFERNFRAIRLAALGEQAGFFTGYYEPVVEGSRLPSDTYTVPLYQRPPNMITQRLRMAGKKGKAGKRVVKRTGAFYDRAQIEDGALAGRGLEIVYLKDPIDAFFAEIQGSVRVKLEDGSVIRLNYASGNGHAYTAVGRFLIERGIVSKEEISMQKIRQYMEANPEEGKALRRLNRSYVFFRETDLSEYEEAIGAQGLPLTAARSIAVDRRLHTYGMPVFVDVTLPIQSEKPDTRFSRLMVAQDTGGAIVGPARADIYLGAGEEAARAAGRFKHPGQFVMLIPNELDPANVARSVPLPLPKPKDGAPTRVASQSVDQDVTSAAKPAPAKPASQATASIKPAAAVPLPSPRPVKRSPGKPGT